nr:hypothetical transcript [Hymenolepis microstoma]
MDRSSRTRYNADLLIGPEKILQLVYLRMSRPPKFGPLSLAQRRIGIFSLYISGLRITLIIDAIVDHGVQPANSQSGIFPNTGGESARDVCVQSRLMGVVMWLQRRRPKQQRNSIGAKLPKTDISLKIPLMPPTHHKRHVAGIDASDMLPSMEITTKNDYLAESTPPGE